MMLHAHIPFCLILWSEEYNVVKDIGVGLSFMSEKEYENLSSSLLKEFKVIYVLSMRYSEVPSIRIERHLSEHHA